MATTEKLPSVETDLISFCVNGRSVEVASAGTRRLSRLLRDDLGLTGTKVGCDAGDCGACTEEILAALVAAAELSSAYVNDGGDIALHLSADAKFVVGMVERPDRPSLFGTTTLCSADPVRGIATSGWRGRSFSLGIADAVTVLADRAAAADAAATIIANAVDLPGHPAIVRVPARELAPDSDLHDQLVTQAVGKLTAADVSQALEAGTRTAERLLRMGLIRSAALSLRGETRVVGNLGESRMIATAARERGLVHA